MRAEKTSAIALETLNALAKHSLKKQGETSTPRRRTDADPLDPAQIDPEARRNPDDALIDLTTAAIIVHALQRQEADHGANHNSGAQRLRRHATAGPSRANIPSLKEFERVIIDRVHDASGATRWTKLSAIAAIAKLDDPYRWNRLWEYARDRDYQVRRAAAKELQQGANEAYDRLCGEIEELVLRAAARRALDLPIVTPTPSFGNRFSKGNGTGAVGAPKSRRDRRHIKPIDPWDPEDVFSLIALGWVLPAIVSGLREDDSEDPSHRTEGGRIANVHTARHALEAVVALAFEGDQHKFEASVAQGFKDDAMRHAADPARGISGPGWVASNRRLVAEICLDHAEFWYSRMLLHQALAIYAVAGANRQDTHAVFARLLHAGREQHEFVRRAGNLAERAVERKQLDSDLWKGLIWEDEGQVVGRRANMLDASTAQLVADVTLLLNLNECSGEDRQVQFGYMHDLPHCLSISKDRNEILGAGCPASCGWGLCPYEQPPPDEPNAHRGVSRAFSRQQQQIARWRHVPWQSTIRRGPLERFWREMERHARL